VSLSPPASSPLIRLIEQHFSFTDRQAVALCIAIAAERRDAELAKRKAAQVEHDIPPSAPNVPPQRGFEWPTPPRRHPDP
jgi:hypothetical protein